MKKPWLALVLCLAGTSAHAIPVKVVKVGAQSIDCAFDPDCTIAATETSSSIPMPGATGTGRLYTRTYKSTSDSRAAGRYMYEYRIDLEPATAVLAASCVTALTVPFPSPATVDYNGNGAADEQVYVVNTGGPGTSGPTSADRSGGKLTFKFSNAVCVGTGPGTGESSYRFGVSASLWPAGVTAVLPNTSGSSSNAGARAPIVFTTGGASAQPSAPSLIPDRSGYIPPGCGTDPVSSPDLLDCWLEAFPNVANTITWEKSDGSHIVEAWPYWTATQKSQLRKAFKHAWQWYDNGLTNFQGTSVPEPPPNKEVLADDGWSLTVLDGPTAAWPLYLAQVAQTMALELGGHVPWTIRIYDSAKLSELLGGHTHYHFDSDIPNDIYNTTYPGYAIRNSNVTPAHSTFIFTFLIANHLVEETRKDTIVQVLGWSRANLQHFLGYYTPLNQQYHWGYRGPAPVSRIIQGTLLTDPQYAASFPNPLHWTPGCYGTTDFLREVLRAVNIPVQKKSSAATCSHTMPYFMTEGRYLSHGDDPYNAINKETPLLPFEEVMIDQATWDQWFTNSADPCDNVGRGVTTQRIKYLSTQLADKYCADEANGLDHASGTVYAEFSAHWSLAELEALTLWERLAVYAQQLGKCGP